MARLWWTALALGLFAAAMWFAWLGWDDEYYLVDGNLQGPYRAWQVVGCALAIAAGAVVAYLWVRRYAAILVLTAASVVGFAVPWAVNAVATDDSGLWIVGLALLMTGSGLGIALLLAVTAIVAKPRQPLSA